MKSIENDVLVDEIIKQANNLASVISLLDSVFDSSSIEELIKQEENKLMIKILLLPANILHKTDG